MQAKDIPDAEFVAAVVEDMTENRLLNLGACWWRVAEERFPTVPPKVVLAKARAMIRRGVLEGCSCGCRGDLRPVGCCDDMAFFDLSDDDKIAMLRSRVPLPPTPLT